MDVTTLYTPQAKTGTPGQNAQVASVNGGTGLFAALPGGTTFMDLIFARLGVQNTQGNAGFSLKNGKTEAGIHKKSAAASETPVLPAPAIITGEDAVLDVQAEGAASVLPALLTGAEDIALPPVIDGTAEIATQSGPEMGMDESIAFITALGQQQADINNMGLAASSEKSIPGLTQKQGEKLFDLLAHLVRGLPEESRTQILSLTKGEFRAALHAEMQKPVSAPTQGQPASPALIAANLTPAKLNELVEIIAGNETQDNESLQSLLAGIVKIAAPQAKREAVFTARAGIMANHIAAQTKAALNTQDVKTDAMPSTLPAEETEISSSMSTLELGGDAMMEKTVDAPQGFERVLKILEQAQQVQPNAAPRQNDAAKAPSAALSTVSSGLPQGDMSVSAIWDSIFPDGFDFSIGADGRPQGNTITGPTLMTSLVSHAQTAMHPHPATQMVAVAMAKVSASGENRSFTVRLDPPDLGKVEIKMEFNSEKHSLKTHLVVEKPETYMMLQRDAHVLERIIQDSFMNAGGGSLSFELSQNGNMFGQDNGHHGGSNDAGGSSINGEDGAEEIIETTMNWYVDPETGMTRYSLLV